MTNLYPIRTAAKALIIRDGDLLTTKNADADGDFYLLPGGGQDYREPLRETMRRECQEEIGCEVEVHDIVHVRDYIGANHEFAERSGGASPHQLEIIFRCTLQPGSEPSNGSATDIWQTGVAWLPLDQLDSYRIYPQYLKQILKPGVDWDRVYLGDVN